MDFAAKKLALSGNAFAPWQVDLAMIATNHILILFFGRCGIQIVAIAFEDGVNHKTSNDQ